MPEQLIRLELPEPPSANRWWRKFRNRMVLSAEARAYKQAVWVRTARYRGTGLEHITALFEAEPVRLSVTWIRGRRAGDLDKRLGVLLDALQGTVYRNDSQIVELHAFRFDPDGEGGRVLVEISATALAQAAPIS